MRGCGESLYLGLFLTLLFKSFLSFSSLSGGSYMGLECVVTFSKTQNKCQVCHLGKPKNYFSCSFDSSCHISQSSSVEDCSCYMLNTLNPSNQRIKFSKMGTRICLLSGHSDRKLLLLLLLSWLQTCCYSLHVSDGKHSHSTS